MENEQRTDMLSVSEYTNRYLSEIADIIPRLDGLMIDDAVDRLTVVKKNNGRMFFIGVGGSAANCSHAVNDFRKIAGIESYAPTDNVAELTARTNDEGWDTVFSKWLKTSHLGENDAVMVLSVGGGNLEKNVSPNIVKALEHAKKVGATTMGIVSRDGGYTAQVADVPIIIPPKYEDMITPFAESIQAVVWHLIANHPKLRN